MAKIFPKSPPTESPPSDPPTESPPSDLDRTAGVMTVWRKSLLFNCSGFTVFDSKGNLLFRVDNYSARSNGEIVLMDSTGKPLLTIRRKRLCIGKNWQIYEGEEDINPRITVKKHVTIFRSDQIAHVTPCGFRNHPESYAVAGSYSQQKCAVYDRCGRVVAEVTRKEAAPGVTIGGDVFRLSVQPELDVALAMAMVVVLDQMYGS